MNHYYVIFGKYPKSGENCKFFLESSVLLIFETSNQNPNINIGGKKVKMGFSFSPRNRPYYNSYFHTTCALLEDFKIFDNVGHIFKAFSTP